MSKAEHGWLIETDGPHYLYLDTVAQLNLFRWTRDAGRAIRFARAADADAVLTGLRRIESDLFKFPTLQAVKAVEHGWGGEVSKDDCPHCQGTGLGAMSRR